MDLQELLRQAANRWGFETVTAIVKKLNSYPILFNGTLRRSISYEQVEPFDIKIYMADYGQFQDEGVDGQDVSHGSPYKFKGNYWGTAYYIKPWADAKGFDNPFGLARHIQSQGIKPRPFFKSVLETRIPDLQKSLNDTYQRYLDDMVSKKSKQ